MRIDSKLSSIKKGEIMGEGQEGYTPEELRMEKSRAESDAELIKGGAEYEKRDGKDVLNLTEEQVESLRTESADAIFSKILEESGDSDAIETAGRNIESRENRVYAALEGAVYWASEGNLKRTIAYLANADIPAETKCRVLSLVELAGGEIHYAGKEDKWSQSMLERSKEEARMFREAK
jgi:hypothetical protein